MTSPILAGCLPLFPESPEYLVVQQIVSQQGIDPQKISLITRNFQRDGTHYIYQVYPKSGAYLSFRISRDQVMPDNNIFHHPELLGQNMLPACESPKTLKRDSSQVTYNVKSNLPVDRYFQTERE